MHSLAAGHPLPNAPLPPLEAPTWRTAFGHPFALGESLTWHAPWQQLVWVDIAGSAAWRGNPSSGHLEHWNMPRTPGCVGITPGGHVVLGLRDGVYAAAAWGGPLHKVWAFLPTRGQTDTLRLNDGRLDNQGHFWVGSYSERREPTAELFCIDLPNDQQPGRVLERFDGFAASNGLAFSATQRSWADTARHQLHLYRLGEREPDVSLQFASKPAGWGFAANSHNDQGYGGRPDGACTDAQGHFWVAMYEGACILQIAPTGQVLRRVATPTLRPTMPCMVGNTLFVTTAQAPPGSAEAAAQPLSGCVWATSI